MASMLPHEPRTSAPAHGSPALGHRFTAAIHGGHRSRKSNPERLGLGPILANAALGRYGQRLLVSTPPEGGARAKIPTDRAEGGLQ
jgi:hypothetical protein